MTTCTEEEDLEKKSCGACCEALPKENFSKKQWEHKKQRRCKVCVASNQNHHRAMATTAALAQTATNAKANKYATGNKKKGRKAKPVCAASQQARYNLSTGDYEASLASRICSWCGKSEETKQFQTCGGCKNICYCSSACQTAAWPEHKLVCEQMKQVRKDVKKEQKARWKKNGKQLDSSLITEASGTGSFYLSHSPGAFSMAGYMGELRGNEEPGCYFASEASKESIRSLLGAQAFRELCRKMEQDTRQAQGTFGRHEYFFDVQELSPIDQFLFSCGPLPDLDHAKATLNMVLYQTSISGRKPDGSIPDIGDITVRGYNLNALEWAARRGNYEIAKWLATDPRTKVMLTRKDSAPVAWACYTNKVELAKMLVKHGADSHATYDVVWMHKPPTHLAADNGQLLAVKYLVEECGHDIHERDISGQNIRTCLRRNCRDWKLVPGSVAVDEYAKSKGVREYT